MPGSLSTFNIVSGTVDYGSGVYNEGQLTVQSSTLSGNSAIHNGGSIASHGALLGALALVRRRK